MSPETDVAADAAWDALLTDLEARVTSGASGTWAPPTDMGPLPRTMVGRASRLLAAQLDAIAAVEAERQTVGAHLAALRTVADSREPARSVYLDVTG